MPSARRVRRALASAAAPAPFTDARVIGLPRALMTYRLGAKWRAFFEELGREVRVSEPSDRGVFERGQALSVDECCLASKLFLGHVDALAGEVDAVFVPSLSGSDALHTYCTKFQALPDLVRSAFALVGREVRVLDALLAEGGAEKDERASYVELAARLGATHREGERAWRAACRAQRDRDASLARAQAELVAASSRLPRAERPLAILVAAHPYVAHDPFVAGPVTDALRAAGATVLFAVEFDHARATRRSYDFSATLPWIVNRELVGAVLELHDAVDGVVLVSAFPCGPDSMTDDAIALCVKGRPVLTLTVDAQSGTAGVETRVESFVDILTYQRRGGYLNG